MFAQKIALELFETEAVRSRTGVRLAYYKAPGFVHIVQSLPTTGTQKIQKHAIYGAGIDPRSVAGVVDLRARKKRDR